MRIATDQRFPRRLPMRSTLILCMILFYGLQLQAQVSVATVSNSWYFSDADTLFFSQAHIKANKINRVKEYFIDGKNADSVRLSSEYRFDASGSIIESKTYSMNGHQSVTAFKITPGGKLAECRVADNTGTLNKTKELLYRNDTLVRQISCYGTGYTTSIGYNYRKDGLLQSIQYYGTGETPGSLTTYTYDSLNRLVSEETTTPGDSNTSSYTYRYDQSGRRCFTQYQEGSLNWTTTADYSKPDANTLVERLYSDGKLMEENTMRYNAQGLLTEKITDRRMSHKRKRKYNMFCGYPGPVPYRKSGYTYDTNGNLTTETLYFSPNKLSERTEYAFDSQGNLVTKTVFEHSKKQAEWRYIYTQ